MPAVIVYEPGDGPRRVYEVTGEMAIGCGREIDVELDGPLAVIAWRDGWWIRPITQDLTIDDEPLRGEQLLRHGQVIRKHHRWSLRFLIGDRTRSLDELRHVETLIDPLTGLLNRRVAHTALARMTSGAVMMIDIDRMNQINDRFGMLAGDAAIRRSAAIVRAHVGWPGLAARYGGEEFLVLMPHTRMSDARELAERIRVEAERLVAYERDTFAATLSIGLAVFTEHALRVADDAVALAKQQGRNRVVASS